MDGRRPRCAYPGTGRDGESGRDCLDRYDRALAGLAAEVTARPHLRDAAHVVVSHGAIIRTWASLRSANLEPRYGAAHPLTNTAVVRLTGTPTDGWICTAWGETEHRVAAPSVADPTAAVLPAT
nr:histidine phosphatase family protein [Nakamurella deserti]